MRTPGYFSLEITDDVLICPGTEEEHNEADIEGPPDPDHRVDIAYAFSNCRGLR